MPLDLPPFLRVYGNMTNTPQEQREVDNEGNDQGCPQPHIFSSNLILQVLVANPAPQLGKILISYLKEGCM